MKIWGTDSNNQFPIIKYRMKVVRKFNELPENNPKFWIISLLDREIRDLVRGPQKRVKIKSISSKRQELHQI